MHVLQFYHPANFGPRRTTTRARAQCSRRCCRCMQACMDASSSGRCLAGDASIDVGAPVRLDGSLTALLG